MLLLLLRMPRKLMLMLHTVLVLVAMLECTPPLSKYPGCLLPQCSPGTLQLYSEARLDAMESRLPCQEIRLEGYNQDKDEGHKDRCI